MIKTYYNFFQKILEDYNIEQKAVPKGAYSHKYFSEITNYFFSINESINFLKKKYEVANIENADEIYIELMTTYTRDIMEHNIYHTSIHL